uniref:Uncharacterized protein n=1 Tax=Corethron hystrix TaxID=216773 RepID=A0A7S1BJH1_9STRA
MPQAFPPAPCKATIREQILGRERSWHSGEQRTTAGFVSRPPAWPGPPETSQTFGQPVLSHQQPDINFGLNSSTLAGTDDGENKHIVMYARAKNFVCLIMFEGEFASRSV